MKVEDFDYYLPEELIAQTPLVKRDESRLLVLDKETGEVEHKKFYDIIDYLNPGDTLVLNDTKVLPARLIGTKEETGAVIEILLLKNIEGDKWECLVKPARRIKEGTIVSFGDGKLKAKCCGVFDAGIRHFELIYSGILMEILEELGTMPLPPYIHEKLEDQSLYQTVYAKEVGSAAAPTAGLHFTNELLEEVKAMGVNIAEVTLHVGLGTFRPVKAEDISEHHMHTEYYRVTEDVADMINNTKKMGKRVICVGTTSCRTIESAADDTGVVHAKEGNTDIFIYPGYEFKIIDSLITKYPASPAAAFYLYRYFTYQLPLDELKATRAKISSELAGCPYVKDLDGIIKQLENVQIGKVAPEFSLPDTAGVSVSLSDFRGKYVLLDFWASWCPPCRRENPNVVKAFNEYKDKNFTIVGISLDKDKSKWMKAIADDNLAWTHLSDLKYWDSEIPALYGVRGIPANVLLDPDGVIVAKNITGEDLHKKLKEVIK